MHRTPEGKSYRFGGHALKRMAQRQIKRRDVECALDGYYTHFLDRKGNDCFIGDLKDGRAIRVVVAKKSSNPMEIITVIILG